MYVFYFIMFRRRHDCTPWFILAPLCSLTSFQRRDAATFVHESTVIHSVCCLHLSLLLFVIVYKISKKQGWHSWYSDCLRAGRQKGRSSSPGRANKFFFSKSSRLALGFTQPPFQWVPGVKRHGREADHSPPTSAELKKMWIYTSTPPYAFMA
jgi:hypothetical protein